MAKTVEIKIKVNDDGSLSMVEQEAKKASAATEKLGTSTDKAGKARNRFHKGEKGVAGATSNSTKAFAKQAQTIGGGSSGLVGAYATLAANVFAMSAAFNFFKRAADISNLEKGQVQYAQNTGVALQSITHRLRESADGMLGFQEAAQAAGIGIAKGFSPAQLENMAVAARKASTALGRDFADSFDRLLRGVSKAEPELLDELGITLRLKTATETYAASLGTTADALTDTQRSQAIYVETMRQANDLFGSVEPQTNAFIKLSKTFEDLAKAGTQAVLPFFEGFANLLSGNAVAAVTVFGAIGISILKMMVPLDGLKDKFKEYDDGQKEALQSTSANLDEVNRKIKATADQEKRAAKIAKNAAKRSGVKTGLVGKLASGKKMNAQQLGQTRAMLKRAEEDFKNHGKARSKILKDVSLKDIKTMRRALDQQVKASKKAHKKMSSHVKRAGLRARKMYLQTKRIGTGTFRAIGRSAQFAGKMASKAMKMAGVIGAFMIVWEVAQKVINAPFSIVGSVLGAIDKVINGAISAFNAVVDSIPKWMLPENMEDGIQMKSNLKGEFEESDIGKKLKGYEDEKKAVQKVKEENERFNETLETMSEELDNIITKFKEKKGLEKDKVALNAMGTLGIGDALAAAGDDKDKIKAVQNQFAGVGGINKKMGAALASGDLDQVRALETASLAATAGMRALDDSVKNIRQNINGGDLIQAQIMLEALELEANGVAIAAEKALGKDSPFASEALKKFSEALGEGVDTKTFITDLQNLNAATIALTLSQQQANFVGKARKEILVARNTLTAAEIELEKNRLAIIAESNPAEKQKLENLTEELRLKVKLAEIENIRLTQGGMMAAVAQTEAMLPGAAATMQDEKASIGDKAGALLDVSSPQLEELKKLGPDGELNASIMEGALQLTETFSDSFATIKEKGLASGEGIKAALGAGSALMGSLINISQKQTKKRVSDIDKQIAAEKKSDGKSKESLEKIKQLEKKKDDIKRKAFEREKKMKLAQAVMATAQGIMNAVGSAPFPFNLPFIAMATAIGAAQIQAIRKSTYQGGGDAPDAGAAASKSEINVGERGKTVDLAKSRSAVGELGYARGEEGIGNMNTFRPAFSGARYRAAGGSAGYVVGEQGPELFMPETPGTIVPAGDTAAGGGASNVNINISAIDAAGVEDVLLNQRANIIGMIRQSANEAGEPFLERVDTIADGASY